MHRISSTAYFSVVSTEWQTNMFPHMHEFAQHCHRCEYLCSYPVAHTVFTINCVLVISGLFRFQNERMTRKAFYSGLVGKCIQITFTSSQLSGKWGGNSVLIRGNGWKNTMTGFSASIKVGCSGHLASWLTGPLRQRHDSLFRSWPLWRSKYSSWD